MDNLDAIIVGGGLAGLAAAYTMAKEGLDVLVLERGDYCGAKNVSGGRIYINPIREIFPDLWEKAPLERHIAHEELCVMDPYRLLNLRYSGAELNEPPYQSYSILRSKFDKWLAKQAERKGAMLVSKSRVDEVIMEKGKVTGVIAGGERLEANVVIACDGVLSFTAEKAGLRKKHDPGHFAVGLKEVLEIDAGLLEERFNLEGNEGAARLYIGDVTAGKFGGGFLYTNQDSISLGLVVGIEALAGEAPYVNVPDMLEAFKKRPEVSRLIKGGETVEYSAHVIPEGGLKMMGRLYGEGVLVAGDAAGLSMNIGVTVRGMEYAMASGYYAAQAVIRAKEKDDYSADTLSVYEQMLNESFVMQDFGNFRESLEVLENPRLFNHYPHLAGNILRDLYAVPAHPKEKIYSSIKKYFSVHEICAVFGDYRRIKKI